nr:alpha-N-acetylglucosaminidase C-terminal domain-containing protein [Bacteroidales bacterium]
YLNDLYASPSKGNCTGYGITAEGVENNELLYELICDAGWMNANDSIDIESWLEQYARCRYGLYNKTLKDLFSTLQNTVYSHYIDHPRFGWQVGNNITGTGNATLNDEFYAGVEALFSNIEELKSQNSPLLAQDLIELAVLYVSGYIEKISAKILATDNSDFAASLIDDLDNLMLDMDAALDLHPLYSLQRWESMAQNMADSDTTRLRNVRNARRIVTIWYGNHTYDEPVRDYASRIWSGLVRDFYRPRLINTLKKKHELIPTFDPIEFENQFVNSAPKLTEVRKVDIDHIDYLAQLIIRAKDIYTATPR